MFVSAALVEGSYTCLVVAKLRRGLGLGLVLFGVRAPRPKSTEKLRPVELKPSLAGELRAFAREPEIARRLLARRLVVRSLEVLAGEGLLMLDDDRIELVLEPANVSSRAIRTVLREASSLAYQLRRLRTEYPRSEHEASVREAWSRQASRRGGHFDDLNEVLSFDSAAGQVRMSVERDDDSAVHGWQTSIVLTFARSLTPASVEALPALKGLQDHTNTVEIDTRRLRALVARPVHDSDELEKLLEAVMAASAAIEESAARSGHAYR